MLKVQSSGTAHSLQPSYKRYNKISIKLNIQVQNTLHFNIMVKVLYLQADLSLLSLVIQALL